MRGAVWCTVIAVLALAGSPVHAGDPAVATEATSADWITNLRNITQVDPGRGEKIAADIERRARLLPPSPETRITILNAQYFRAEALVQLNRADAAEPIIEAALNSLPAAATNTKLHGDLLRARANVYSSKGKAHEALDDYQAAYRVFVRAKLPRPQAVALMGIGSIYQDAGDFQHVLYYYGLAGEAYSGDALLSLSSSNNQANALADLHRYRDAELKYRDALKYAQKLDSPVLEARILNNIAGMQIDTGQLDAAEATLKRGLGIARAQSGAAEWRPLLLGTEARLELARRRPGLAVRLIEQAVAGKAPADIADQSYRDLHRTAFLAYKGVGDSRKALDHFEAYTKLDDEGRSLVTQTNASLLGARFDFANQNARISALKATRLQQDVALARVEARQNALILGSLLAIVSIVAVLLSLYLRTLRRSRNTIRGANETLSRVNGELEHALTAKSRFLATTSHEIRTPLNGVLGMTQVLLADPTVRSDVRERIALVHGAGESMRALVDDILEFAKIDAGTLETAKADMDIHALLRTVVEFWQAQATTKGLHLTLEIGDDVPRHIVEDERRVRQVLLNLLSNAIKFTLAGSIVVRATTLVATAGERLAITVSDTGVGIPGDAFETIFEKFSQLDNSTTRNFGGTGLGLAISRSIAQALDGDIAVTSTPGAGSNFTLSLPLVRAATSAAALPSAGTSDAAAELAQAHVMLVGGGLIGQSVIRNLLNGAVDTFSAAATVEAALAHPQIEDADIIIVDTSTVGTDLGALVLGLAGETRPRFVAILPAGDDSETARLIDDGIERVLARPIGGAALLRALSELFEGLDESVKKEQVQVDHGAA